MTDNYIQLNKSNVLRLEIKDENGISTGEFLEFDLEDIELPLKYQEIIERNKKNTEYLQNQLFIIEKRKDVKGKKLLSKNEEDKIKAIKDYFNKQVEVYNIFLGENGVQKLLNGRKIGWETLSEIGDIISTQIMPKIDLKVVDITEKIKKKYGNKEIEIIDVIE